MSILEIQKHRTVMNRVKTQLFPEKSSLTN